MTLARLRGDGLGDNAAEEIEVYDVIELAAEAGGASSKKDRALEGCAEQLHRAHGRSTGGPRRPGIGGGTSSRTAGGSVGVRVTRIPISRASEASAAAEARLASPLNARV